MTQPLLSAAGLLAAAAVIGRALAAESAGYDRDARANFDAFRRIGELKLGALRVPAAYGGAGGSYADLVTLIIELASGDPSVAQGLLPHFVFVERTLLMATPVQCGDFLTQVAQGALVGGASAEAGGRYRGEVRTRLTRHGDGYRLHGDKHYSTGALMGQILKVMAVDDAEESVLVVIPAGRDGVTRYDDWTGMGQRGTLSGRTELREVAVADHEVMRVQRWQQERHHTGAASQLIHCAIEAGIARAALQDAADWARQHVRPVKESGLAQGNQDPYLLHTVGEIAARSHMADALIYAAAARVERAAQARFGGESAGVIEQTAIEASIATAEAKVISTEVALFAAQALFDVGGASMTLREHDFDRHWRNARTHTTHDPAAWKYRAIGDYRLNQQPPPISYGY